MVWAADGFVVAQHVTGERALEGGRKACGRPSREGIVEGEDAALVRLVELGRRRGLRALERVRVERDVAELEFVRVQDDFGSLFVDFQAENQG